MRARFEVQVQRDGRWVVEEMEVTEQAAVGRANRQLQRGGCTAVRVVRERLGRDTVLFERTAGDGSGPDPRAAPASPIQEAPDCETVEDLMRLEARLAAGKVLRKWFDLNTVTPTETLHNYRALSRLMDSEPMCYPSAVDRVATVQARRQGSDARERREALFRLIEEAGRRTRSAEGEKAIRKLGLGSFSKLCRVAEQAAWIPQDRDVLIRVAVSRDLIGMGSWLAKLEALLLAVSAELPAEDLAILDGFIADVLGSSQAVQDILGDRPNLAAALVALIDILEGKPGAGAEPDVVAVLRRLLADGRLSAAWTVLRDRVMSEVRGTQPLSRNDPANEEAAFEALTGRILGFRRLAEGPDMAQALTSRCGRRFTEGGKAGAQRAIAAMGDMIADRSRRLRYYLDMLDTPMGTDCAPMVAARIRDTIGEAVDIHGFVAVEEPAHDKLSALGSLQRALGRAKALPPQVRTHLVERLDQLVVDYLVGERVIERLDDPSDPLRIRALRLVRFVASGLLVEGKALDLARARVVEHLRQPGFIENFTADIDDPTHKETAIRDFWAMLTAAGFNGGSGAGG